MIVKRGDGDYARVYRPLRISEVYGQDTIKTIIAKGLEDGSLSKTLLFSGVSGTGKTTVARIIAMGWNCSKGRTSEPCSECDSCHQVLHRGHFAFQEINSGDYSGIDKVRALKADFAAAPMGYFDKKVILFDECHRLTKEAQTLLLPEIEDAYTHLQFIFCSTEEKKILDTLSNRCLTLRFEPLPNDLIVKLLQDVCKWEIIKYDDRVLERIAQESKGMARNALFLLQKVVQRGELEQIGRKSEI